ncbi:hypothetical protein [Halodesulfovibrio sp. MK-HDV]|nr:hypothetical protein [Halodesulfovibrio sp. MK-HDV]
MFHKVIPYKKNGLIRIIANQAKLIITTGKCKGMMRVSGVITRLPEF